MARPERVGIMQPYFFPYLGHFALIAHTTRWIVFDVTQYTPKTWMNRNAVLHPSGGRNWISVNLANGSISINSQQARILNVDASRKTALGKLTHYKRHAPYYRRVVDLVEQAFDLPAGDDSLVHLNVRGLAAVCAELNLSFDYNICSEMGLDVPEEVEAGEWALDICKAIGACNYLNPVGGRHLFDPLKYAREGVGIQYLETTPMRYATGGYKFVEELSILDVLMWNEPSAVREALFSHSSILDA